MAAPLTEGLSTDAQAKFKLLQQRFVLGLPARWTELSEASAPASRQMMLHRLAGGAGSYGFARISQLAREAENLAAASPSAELAQALALLKSEIDATVANNPTVPQEPGRQSVLRR